MEFSSNTNAKYTENPQWDIPGKNQTGVEDMEFSGVSKK